MALASALQFSSDEAGSTAAHAAVLPPAVARPRENASTVLPKTNYSFIMMMMAQSAVNKAAMILFVVGLLCLGMAIGGIMPLAVGVVVLGLALLSSGIGFFAGKGARPQPILEDNAQSALTSAV